MPVPNEIRGFVGWITTVAVLVLYLAWTFCPTRGYVDKAICKGDRNRCAPSLIRAELPDQYWSLALPSFVVATLIYAYLVYTSIILCTVTDLDDTMSFESYKDKQQQQQQNGGTTSSIEDIPIEEINRMIYDNDYD